MKKLVLVLVIASLCLVSFGCAQEAAPAPAPAPAKTVTKTVEQTVTVTPEPIKLIFASCWAEQNIGGQAAKGWCEYVTMMTNGRVTFDYYWSGAIAGGKEHLAAFSTGLADVGPFASAYTPAEFPLNTLWEMPYAAKYSDSIAEGAWEVIKDFPQYTEDYTRNNIHLLVHCGTGPVFIEGIGEPILDVEGFKGRKLRVPGKIGLVVEAMGGVPTTTLASEIYGAMEQGLLEACFLSLVDAYSLKVGELADWVLDAGMGLYHNTQVVVNLDTLNSMPADVKEIMLSKEAEQASIDFYMKYQNDIERMVVADFKGRGIKFIKFSDAEVAKAKEIAKKVWDDVIAEKPDPEMARKFWYRWVELAPQFDAETAYVEPEI